jgi:PAS domain S-box-containing protein
MTFTQAELRMALESGQFVPFFQPVIDLRTRELRGYELLARWRHPVHGLLAPDCFIARAEADGWIAELTATLLSEGFRRMVALDVERDCERMLSVNISPLQLRDLRLPRQIEDAARQAGFPLSRLVVEITESALMEDLGMARAIVSDLKAAGALLAIDDFGTGYSSLLHLQSLPFDELKVDRSFVATMATQRDSRKIVAAVVGLGQSLGLTTVAEGVETAEQAEMLLWLGCEMGQGWLYGKPVTDADLARQPEKHASQQRPAAPRSLPGRLSVSTLNRDPSQSLGQLQAIYDGAPVGLAYLDREQRYLHLNRRLAAMNGLPMEQHLGRTVAEVLPEHYSTLEPFLARALRGEAIGGVEITRPSKGSGPAQTILLSYEPALDEANEVVGVLVAIVDMTSIKQTEAALRETEAHFRNMMELIPQIPWVIDAEGRALDVSQRWLTLSGMTGAEWRGFGWLEALHPADREGTIAGMQTAFESGKPIDLQYRVRSSPADPWQRVRARGAPRRAADGSIQCWYGVLELVDDSGTPIH